MNKTKSSKLTHKSQHPMRLLFKIRGNNHGVIRTLENDSQADEPSNTSLVVAERQDEEESIEQRYGNSRMRTEYSDRFGLFKRSNRSFHHVKRKQDDRQSPSKNDQDHNATHNKSFSKLNFTQANDNTPEKKTIESKKQEQRLPQIKEAPPSFEEIEDKIEGLMTKRLNECLQFKKKNDWEIDSELTKLIDAYKQAKSSKNPQMQDQDIHLLSRRIAMLQKLIAESMTESDIVKKYYMGKVSNQHWKHHKTESFSCVEPVRSINRQHKQESLINTSNNRESYQQPDRSAYDFEKRGNYFFNPDRHKQPLPRSSYNRDFLTYGAVQNMSSCKPTENECLKAASSAKIMNSSYRSNFVAKKAEKINIKELDACRDKIKNLPIIFGKREKDIIAYNLATFLKLKNSNNKISHVSHSIERTEAKPTASNHFISESRKQFIRAVPISPSQIKHKNLQKLKYSYKKELHV